MNELVKFTSFIGCSRGFFLFLLNRYMNELVKFTSFVGYSRSL
jgi:hypothetical protein